MRKRVSLRGECTMKRYTHRSRIPGAALSVSDLGKALEKLADYEDMEEARRLLELPLPFGETVYRVVCRCACDGPCTNDGCCGCEYSGYGVESTVFDVSMLPMFGLTTFEDREDAERRAEELSGGIRRHSDDEG